MGKQYALFSGISDEFDPDNQHPGAYDYDIPEAIAIVSYDAATVLSHGIDLALLKNTTVTPQDLENALPQITGSQAWQGVSGLIDFGPDHDPINKALVVLKIDNTGHFQMCSVQGHFSANSDGSPWQCPT